MGFFSTQFYFGLLSSKSASLFFDVFLLRHNLANIATMMVITIIKPGIESNAHMPEEHSLINGSSPQGRSSAILILVAYLKIH